MRALILLLLAPAAASAEELYTLDPSASTVTYHLVHKMHRVDGVSKRAEGKARLLPTGQVQVAVSAPVDSFDSGNVNRDASMKEAVEAARFPTVEVKALADAVAAPAGFPATVEKKAKVQLTFHGVQELLEVPVKIEWQAPGQVRVTGSFTISLDHHKVERPSLMFIKVDDALKIDAALAFRK